MKPFHLLTLLPLLILSACLPLAEKSNGTANDAHQTYPSLASDLSGLWNWTSNNAKSTFALTLKKIDQEKYTVSYCAVALSGDKIDCASDKENTSSMSLGTPFSYQSNFSGKTGTAIINFSDEKLHWLITKQPNGEHYAPKQATLTRGKRMP